MPSGRYLLGWLFFCSLTFCLCLSQITLATWQANAEQYLNQGIPSYAYRNFENVIKQGEKALKVSNITSEVVEQALYLLEKLPDSPSKVYAAIDLANFVQSPPSGAISSLVECPESLKNSKALDLLVQAVSIARRLKDFSAFSFALGNLGHFYECRFDYQQALKLTKQAQNIAEKEPNSQDNLFLWYWQTGRILKAQNQFIESINYYEETCKILNKLIIVSWNITQKFNFDIRDAFGIVYRQFIDLKLTLLNENFTKLTKESVNDYLNTISVAIEQLRIVETQKYCIVNCKLLVDNNKQLSLELEKKRAAILNTIILEKKTAIIITFPSGYKKFKLINLDSKTLRAEVNKFRIGLEDYGNIIYNPEQAQKLYDWIVRPFGNDLESLGIKTLVFIQDGILRSVPMAALHDGEKFLVEKYAIANTLSLTSTNLQTVQRENLRALVVGLTKDATVNGRRYQALSKVASEIREVEEQIPGSKQLLNQNFTRDRLRAELHQNLYPIIHIATHGEFGNDPEDTFLVTGDNDKLTITDLDSIIRSLGDDAKTIDLLTLTACETAIGNDSTALGLAGVAVQAGVRTSLASLWSINDASTVELVTKFYQAWRHSGVSKAEALRTAQQALISSNKVSSHPAYWAAFILVGNWL
jgi:CHAT domain-containing protein